MQIQKQYDVAIIGGGLAGLSCAIQLQKAGHSVIVFEKEKYPFHKVCGEYVSMESRKFLESLGINISAMNLPVIDTLLLTAPNGKFLYAKLPLGGFGISRYLLDDQLKIIAEKYGVFVLEETKVNQVDYDEKFSIGFNSRLTPENSVFAKVCCAAYGKRSNLDVKWKRKFLNHHDKRLDNYVGVKYHIKTNWKENVIGLHNFKNGYCGISKIEDDKYTLCYMTRAESLRNCNNSIEELEKKVLRKNHHLQKIFSESAILKEFPLTISQINFHKKSQVENHVMMLGDTAGMITPLCGNGMSIALHTGKIGAELIHLFLQGKISRKQMESLYVRQWNQNFATRLKAGRTLQRFFGSERLSNFFVSVFKTFPFLAKPVIRLTHGKPF